MNLVPVFSHPQATTTSSAKVALMANVTASYYYADGEMATVSVDVENDYPDAIDEARVNAIRGLRELTGIGEVSHVAEFDD